MLFASVFGRPPLLENPLFENPRLAFIFGLLMPLLLPFCVFAKAACRPHAKPSEEFPVREFEVTNSCEWLGGQSTRSGLIIGAAIH